MVRAGSRLYDLIYLQSRLSSFIRGYDPPREDGGDGVHLVHGDGRDGDGVYYAYDNIGDGSVHGVNYAHDDVGDGDVGDVGDGDSNINMI